MLKIGCVIHIGLAQLVISTWPPRPHRKAKLGWVVDYNLALTTQGQSQGQVQAGPFLLYYGSCPSWGSGGYIGANNLFIFPIQPFISLGSWHTMMCSFELQCPRCWNDLHATQNNFPRSRISWCIPIPMICWWRTMFSRQIVLPVHKVFVYCARVEGFKAVLAIYQKWVPTNGYISKHERIGLYVQNSHAWKLIQDSTRRSFMIISLIEKSVFIEGMPLM